MNSSDIDSLLLESQALLSKYQPLPGDFAAANDDFEYNDGSMRPPHAQPATAQSVSALVLDDDLQDTLNQQTELVMAMSSQLQYSKSQTKAALAQRDRISTEYLSLSKSMDTHVHEYDGVMKFLKKRESILQDLFSQVGSLSEAVDLKISEVSANFYTLLDPIQSSVDSFSAQVNKLEDVVARKKELAITFADLAEINDTLEGQVLELTTNLYYTTNQARDLQRDLGLSSEEVKQLQQRHSKSATRVEDLEGVLAEMQAEVKNKDKLYFELHNTFSSLKTQQKSESSSHQASIELLKSEMKKEIKRTDESYQKKICELRNQFGNSSSNATVDLLMQKIRVQKTEIQRHQRQAAESSSLTSRAVGPPRVTRKRKQPSKTVDKKRDRRRRAADSDSDYGGQIDLTHVRNNEYLDFID